MRAKISIQESEWISKQVSNIGDATTSEAASSVKQDQNRRKKKNAELSVVSNVQN